MHKKALEDHTVAIKDKDLKKNLSHKIKDARLASRRLSGKEGYRAGMIESVPRNQINVKKNLSTRHIS